MALSAYEVHYIVDSVANNTRVDGRHNLQYRPYQLQLSVFPNTFGSAYIYYPSNGQQVYASIKAEVVKPSAETPDEGFVKFYLDSTYETKRHTLEEYAKQKQEIISTLETMLINPQGIDKKCLVLKSGVFCWLLHIDLLVFQPISLSQIDILAVAIKTALADLALPKIEVFFNANTKSNDFEMQEDLLNWGQITKGKPIPTVITLGLHEGKYAVDMTEEEYQAIENKVVIGMAGSEITGVETFGVSMNAEEFDKAVEVAGQMVAKVDKNIDAGIKKFNGKVVEIDIN